MWSRETGDGRDAGGCIIGMKRDGVDILYRFSRAAFWTGGALPRSLLVSRLSKKRGRVAVSAAALTASPPSFVNSSSFLPTSSSRTCRVLATAGAVPLLSKVPFLVKPLIGGHLMHSFLFPCLQEYGKCVSNVLGVKGGIIIDKL